MNQTTSAWGGRFVTLGAVVLLLVAVAIPAALRRSGDGPNDAAPAPAAEPDPRAEAGASATPRVFRFYQEYPHTLDPARSADSYSAGVIAQIYSPLVGLT